MTYEKIHSEVRELVLEIRQYLCNTEFAPAPFTQPVDLNVLTKEFPTKFLNIKVGGICPECEGFGYLPDADTGEPNPPVGDIRYRRLH